MSRQLRKQRHIIVVRQGVGAQALKVVEDKIEEPFVQEAHRELYRVVGQIKELEAFGQITNGSHRNQLVGAQVQLDQMGRQTRQARGHFAEAVARQIQLAEVGLFLLGRVVVTPVRQSLELGLVVLVGSMRLTHKKTKSMTHKLCTFFGSSKLSHKRK